MQYCVEPNQPFAQIPTCHPVLTAELQSTPSHLAEPTLGDGESPSVPPEAERDPSLLPPPSPPSTHRQTVTAAPSAGDTNLWETPPPRRRR